MNVYVWQQVSIPAGTQEALLSTVGYGSAMSVAMIHYRRSYYRANLDGRRPRGRPRKSWKDNIKEWMAQSMSSLLRVAEDRCRWVAITAEASVGVPQQRLRITGFG